MNKKTTIVLLILLLAIVLFAFSPSNFFLYRASSSTSIYPISKSERNDSIGDKETIALDKTKPYRITIHGLSDDSNTSNNESKGDINVYATKSNSVGLLRFIPIFKPINFSSTISYRWVTPLHKNIQSSNSNSGSFEMRGRYYIFGICSPKRAKQVVLNNIFEQAQNQIKEDIKKKIGF